MPLVRPRLSDHYGIPLRQDQVDFAIPYLDEDLPLCVDPFLLWKSPSQQDQALHQSLINEFNRLGSSYLTGNSTVAIQGLVQASECDEVGLGFSGQRKGKRISRKLAEIILNLFKDIPQLRQNGFTHLEAAQLLISGVSSDRVSDIACFFLKSFLIDYTIQQCRRHSIPLNRMSISAYEQRSGVIKHETIELPMSPATKRAVLLVPRRWLRSVPWIAYDDFYKAHYIPHLGLPAEATTTRIDVLDFNRQNYNLVESYINAKERTAANCHNDPLFSPIPVMSAKRRLAEVLRLPRGREHGADKRYEEICAQLLSSLLYPHLDFAESQSRTDSGVHICDLIFYNNVSEPVLETFYDEYKAKQIVFEMKNVASLESEHIDQLSRYLKDQYGRFGVIVTRSAPSRATSKNIIDLWSAHRKCILVLTDQEIELMVDLFESKQRNPFDVLTKTYVEFTRRCPS